MRRIYSTLTLLLLSVLFFQCQREVGFIGTPDNPSSIPTPDPITATIQGNVFDETGQPAAEVAIKVGGKTVTTNSNGYFRITDAALDKKSALVTATKAGYFKAYRTFTATSGANQVEIKLIKKVVAGTIDGATGGQASLNNGSKITLPANSVVNAATNAAYNGAVKVYASYIDPTAADIGQTVPGSFMANNKEGRRVSLVSYGMMAVELESATGEKLQIKPGTTATLTTAIPTAAQASAPATIALWYVDETTGIWKEEGTATRNGNIYVGQVNHFSFWNCDVSVNAVILSLTVKNSDGAPLVNAAVRIKRAATKWTDAAYGFTDSLGQVSGYVPSNEPLVLEVLDGCNEPFYTQNIDPLIQNTNLGAITLTNTSTVIITVKGKLSDCNSAPVTDGYAIIYYGNSVHYASVNATGNFQSTFTRCASSPAEFTIIGVDNTSLQQSSSSSVTAATPVTDAGTISACGTSATQFINYTLDGTEYSITTPPVTADSLMGSTLPNQGGTGFTTAIIGAQSAPNNAFLYIKFNSPTAAAGTYPLTGITIQGFWQDVTLVQPFTITITNFPQAVGEFYEGSFTGQFKDEQNTSHSISATFKVRRQE